MLFAYRVNTGLTPDAHVLSSGSRILAGAATMDFHRGWHAIAKAPLLRMRARQGASQTKWGGHYKKRWGDDQRVPLPFRRGIPFRGDCLTGGYSGVQAITLATG